MSIAKELECASSEDEDPWALDLGTYYGHSAWCLMYGASLCRSHPRLRILSLNIFDFPNYHFEDVTVKTFTAKYGVPSEKSISQYLDDVCQSAGIVNNILVKRTDVSSLLVTELLSVTPRGFKFVAVDCAKTPSLMNRIANLLTNPSVAPIGTLVIFQDLLDWHTPWNIYGFWKMMENGNLTCKAMSRTAGPVAEIVSHNRLEEICEEGLPDNQFTSLENELAAYSELEQIATKANAKFYIRMLQVNKVGVYIRHEEMELAKDLLDTLDRTWPKYASDRWLQFGYSRFLNHQTGKLDRNVIIPSIHTKNRRQGLWPLMQRATNACGKLFPSMAVSM